MYLCNTTRVLGEMDSRQTKQDINITDSLLETDWYRVDGVDIAQSAENTEGCSTVNRYWMDGDVIIDSSIIIISI